MQEQRVEFTYILPSNSAVARKMATSTCTSSPSFYATFKEYVDRYFSLAPTWPNTAERDFAYRRSTYSHLVVVHIMPSLLAITLMVHERLSHTGTGTGTGAL
jgi:hypothetical protein